MKLKNLAAAALAFAVPGLAMAAGNAGFAGPGIGPVPLEFVLFACVLAGVALLPSATRCASRSAARSSIALYKILLSPFKTGAGVGGFAAAPAATSG